MRRLAILATVIAAAATLSSCGDYPVQFGSATSSGGGTDTGGGSSTADVTVGDNFFDPTLVTVTRDVGGATVTWTWTGQNVHQIVFDDNGPGSGAQSSGQFQRQFTDAGVFTYYCSIHGRSVMSGTVVVQ